jgi:hypothetical protein
MLRLGDRMSKFLLQFRTLFVEFTLYQLDVAGIERSICAVDKPVCMQLTPSEQRARKGGPETLNSFYPVSLDIGRRFYAKRSECQFATGTNFRDLGVGYAKALKVA